MRTMSRVDSQERRPSEVFMFSHRTTIRDEMGQAFVELAIVLPVAILLLVGAAEIGRLAFASIEVSNAARAGVAYGAQSHVTASDIAGIQTAATLQASRRQRPNRVPVSTERRLQLLAALLRARTVPVPLASSNLFW
jgi:Flp pilus assembly protein TadG